MGEPTGRTLTEHTMCDPSMKPEPPRAIPVPLHPCGAGAGALKASAHLFQLKLGVLIPLPLAGPVSQVQQEVRPSRMFLAFLKNSSKCWTLFSQRNFEPTLLTLEFPTRQAPL